MSANEKVAQYVQKLRRKHRLIRDEVDAVPWPHPRPARDERIVCLNIAFIWSSLVQIIFGAPFVSVQGQVLDRTATAAFGVLMIVSSGLVLAAAVIKSQYVSFGLEMGGTVGFSGVFLIYSVLAIMGFPDWFGTTSAAFTSALFLGNALRAQKLIRRLW